MDTVDNFTARLNLRRKILLMYRYLVLLSAGLCTTCLEGHQAPLTESHEDSSSRESKLIVNSLHSTPLPATTDQKSLKRPIEVDAPQITKKPASCSQRSTLTRTPSSELAVGESDAAAVFRGESPWAKDGKHRNSMKELFLRGLTSHAAMQSDGEILIIVMCRLNSCSPDHPKVIDGIRAYRAGVFQQTGGNPPRL